MVQILPLLASLTMAATFDAPGADMGALLRQIRADVRLERAQLLDASPVAEPEPIVVTISGLEMARIGRGLELRQLQRIFPKEARRMKPENYLETDIKNAAGRNHMELDVRHFSWSRDPKETDATIERFERDLRALADRSGGRPIFIISHSWGTVLAHETLTRLAKSGRPVTVRRLVTMGSPLVPTTLVTRLFKEYHNAADRLQRRVAKPAGVERWVNLWAAHDPYSGPISAADENVRVDGRVGAVVVRLRAAATEANARAVIRDLAAVTDGMSWHESYRSGFKARLDSINEDLDWDILQENLGYILPWAPL